MRRAAKFKFSYISFILVVCMSVLMSPFFGNFTPEHLPRLILVAIVIAFPWALFAGTILHIR